MKFLKLKLIDKKLLSGSYFAAFVAFMQFFAKMQYYFFKDGSFQTASVFMLEDLGEAFQHEVLKMLKKEGKINDTIIENMLSWYHSGFNVYIGDRIEPDDKA